MKRRVETHAGPEKESSPLDAATARREIPHEAYAEAVIAELRVRRPKLPDDVVLESIFVGGGTPSLWAPESMARVLDAIRESFRSDDNLEITAESNPTSLDSAQIRGMLAAGVNRISIGVQSIDEEQLHFLGRLHDAAGGLAAVELALSAGVPRVSADLIYGVDRQSPERAREAALRVAALGVTHLSAYTLTIEENTRFGALARAGKLPLLEDTLVAESYRAVSRALEEIGFEHYEVSNFAKPSKRSRHNERYWKGEDYLGLGSGAVGTVRFAEGAARLRYKNLLAIERYLDAFRAPTHDPYEEKLAERETLSPDDTLKEILLLGLRLREGMTRAHAEQRSGAALWTPGRRRAAERLFAHGNLVGDLESFSIPHDRWLYADGIVVDLL